MPNISLYTRANHTKNGEVIDLQLFFEYIQAGYWQDIVLPIRAIADKKQRDELKKRAPNVTLSGEFNERTDAGLKKHSGIIGIDIDDVDPEEVKKVLHNDPYVYGMFSSISGRGLCVCFSIAPGKHREAFSGISEYLHTQYGLTVDPTSINPSRARFISFDPYLYLNPNAQKFTLYPKKEKPKPAQPVVFVQTDFDLIIQQIQQQSINICHNYRDWLTIGFALADKFGEGGRMYFQIISQISAGSRPDSQAANPALIDRQYSACLKSRGSGVTIATFYWMCKAAGIQTASDTTKLVQKTAYQSKQGKRTKEDTVRLLAEVEGIPATETADIVNQIFTQAIHPGSDSIIDDVEQWLRQNYQLRRNVITGYVENAGTPLDTRGFNTIYLELKRIYEKLTFELFERIVNSDFVQNYNPLREFFAVNEHRHPAGCIAALFNSINTDTGLGENEFFPEYAVHFGTAWLVGAIASVYGQHSPLMLVLTGEKQNTGKTQFFRRLLPTELAAKYYAESKLDAGKDDQLLMTQKWIIMDDEMGGKSKKEEKILKDLTSKQVFSLREPYGRRNSDLTRIAVLCGTTNQREVISDPTGNRRILPINVLSIDHQAYNAVDKTDLLMEAYWLWREGFKWELTQDDIKLLAENTDPFVEPLAELELITRYFRMPVFQGEAHGHEFLTTTEIKAYLEIMTRQKLGINKIGQCMRKIGWEQKCKRRNEMPVKGYWVVKVDTTYNQVTTPDTTV